MDSEWASDHNLQIYNDMLGSVENMVVAENIADEDESIGTIV